MPTVCCAVKCSHNFKNCKLKKFPTNATKARVWESLLRRKNFKRKAFHRICVCHFDEEQFERQNDKNGRRLRADAVPLHFPTHTVKHRSLGGDNYIEEERKTVGFIDGKDLPLKNLIRFVNSKQNLTECQYDVKLYNRSTNGITSNEEWSTVGSIDGKDMPQRNWMQFVNFKENIMESQYDGKLYNRTFDDVPSSKELFAYYGGSSQQQLEIQNIKENIGGPHSNLVAHAHDKTPMVLRERTQTETENDENENDAPAIKQELIPDLPSAVKKENEQIQTETEYDENENDAPALELEIVPDVVPSAVKEKDERTQIKTEHDENENDAPPIEMEIVPDLVPFGVKEKNAAPPQEPVSTGTLPASETKQTPKDEKKYFCAYCSKTFKDMGQLRQHIRIHTGEKPYTCTHCPRKFSQQCHLDVHTRNHTGEKPFSCTHCSKKFNQKVHLVKHERIHTGEKPFSCTICSRKFNDASNLRQHLWTHRDEKPYSCSYCSKQFCRKKYLDIHTKDIHGDEATLPHVDE